MKISFLYRSLILGALAIFAISQPIIAAADDDYAALKAEMKAKRDSCGAITPPTAEAGFCLRACGAGLGFLHSSSDAQTVAQVVASCRTAHQNSGAKKTTTPATIDTKRNQTKLATEAREKAFSCSRSKPRTQEKIDCRSKCNNAAYNLERQQNEISNAVMNDLKNCNAAYAAAGLDQDESSTPKQTEADKINDMPGNASFCKTKMANTPCSLSDFSNRDTLCHSLRTCEKTCVYENVAQALAGTDRNIRIKARKAMNSCIESRNRVNELLDK
jgi:hypothetical protein